eukprot:scaffold7896_cov177-Ochromonas_danica.AAC.2
MRLAINISSLLEHEMVAALQRNNDWSYLRIGMLWRVLNLPKKHNLHLKLITVETVLERESIDQTISQSYLHCWVGSVGGGQSLR